MKKKAFSIVLFAAAILLTLAFAAFLIRDYLTVYPYGSAPFYIYTITLAGEFLFPAALCIIIGILLTGRKGNQSDESI